jgi:drug/metabolite transporter (DMT)-like permease
LKAPNFATMKQAFVKLHLAILLAGFTGVFGKLIQLNEGLLVWYRLSFAGLLLWSMLAVTNNLKRLPTGEVIRIMTAGWLLAMHWVFFYGSIKYANVSVGVVCFALTSFFTAVAEPLINRKRFSVSELLLSGLTLCGIALIFHFDTEFRFGIVLGVISSIFIAVFTVINERFTKRYDSTLLTTYQFTGGWIGVTLLMPLYLYISPVDSLLPTAQDLAYLVVFVVFCTVTMFRLITQSLREIPAFTVNLSFNLEPLYTIALAMLIFHEQRELNIWFYVGLGLILLSLALQMVRLRRQHLARLQPTWE